MAALPHKKGTHASHIQNEALETSPTVISLSATHLSLAPEPCQSLEVLNVCLDTHLETVRRLPQKIQDGPVDVVVGHASP